MAVYELNIIYRCLPKQELFNCIKRTANYIFDKGGFLRKIENFGEKPLPYKMRSHGILHRKANFFMIEFSAPLLSLEKLIEECGRDIDIIQRKIIKQKVSEPFECTFEDEMKPPPYRPDVIELMKTKFTRGKRFTKEFKYNSGLDFYPFQK